MFTDIPNTLVSQGEYGRSLQWFKTWNRRSIVERTGFIFCLGTSCKLSMDKQSYRVQSNHLITQRPRSISIQSELNSLPTQQNSVRIVNTSDSLSCFHFISSSVRLLVFFLHPTVCPLFFWSVGICVTLICHLITRHHRSGARADKVTAYQREQEMRETGGNSGHVVSPINPLLWGISGMEVESLILLLYILFRQETALIKNVH